MTVEIRATRKVVVVGWDTEQVKGASASIQVEDEEKRTAQNDGSANLYFPAAFEGEVEVTVVGSKEGTDEGTISVK